MSGVVKDKATAFKHELVGSTTNKIICKASSHEVAGPKKKHVDYLIHLTNDPHCSMPMMADLINDRLRNSNWVVVFKALVVTHNLMTLGNEKFLQCLATRNTNFALETFSDKSDLLATDMTTFVRRYAKYLSYMATGYRMLATDVCRFPKGDKSPFRNMETGKLLKATAIVRQQLDYLLEVEMTANELTNGVINTAFLMMYKDLIKLYTAYNDSLINLLEKFFEMKKQYCREAIEIYRRFLTRQEGVQKFLQLAEEVGVDRQSHLNLRQVPEDLLPALEAHLSDMDSIKKAAHQPSPAIKAASEKLAALKDSPSSEEKAKPTPTSPISGFPSASTEILEAQRKRFEELKRLAGASKGGQDSSEKDKSKDSPAIKQSSTSAVTAKSPEDLEFDQIAASSALQPVKQPSNTDDLLSLEVSFPNIPLQSNPWVTQAPPPSSNPFQPAPPVPVTNNISDPWGPQSSTGYQEVDLFTEIRGGQPDFDAVFGQQSLVPSQPQPASLGGILLPTVVGHHATSQETMPQVTGLTSDVESSLAKAAQNLSVELSVTGRTGITRKMEHQWKPAAQPMMTGGPNWQPRQIQPKTLPPGPQDNAPKGGIPVDWSRGMYAGHFPVQPVPVVPQFHPMPQQPYMMQQPPTMQPALWPQQPMDPFGPIGTQPTQLF